MKINQNTISMLKNCAMIVNSMIVSKGNSQNIKTVNNKKLLKIELDQEFPETFGIYDLSKFISVVSTLSDPELNFEENVIKITDSNGFKVDFNSSSLQLLQEYQATDENLIKLDKSQKLFEFDLDVKILEKILSLSKINELDFLEIKLENNQLFLIASKKGNDSSNKVTIKVGQTEYKDFLKGVLLSNLTIPVQLYKMNVHENFVEFVSDKMKFYSPFEK